jgi:hypothetical protein
MVSTDHASHSAKQVSFRFAHLEQTLSNQRIIERIRTLADQLEAGEITLEGLADTLLGHVEAIEGISYNRIQEANYVWGQLTKAIAAGQQDAVKTDAVVGFLRQWTLLVSKETSI